MIVHVTDQEFIEAGLLIETRYVVVSIYDPRKRKAKVRRQSGLVDVLHLRFHDAQPGPNVELPPDIKVMTPAQAKAILDE